MGGIMPGWTRALKRRVMQGTAIALLIVSVGGAAARADTSNLVPKTYELEATIGPGNGAVASTHIDSGPGHWVFDVEISEGNVTDLFVQLWYVERSRGCADTEVGNEHYSANEKGKRKLYLQETRYQVIFESRRAGTHCPRLIIWGQRGATATAKVTPLATASAGSLLDLLPTSR